jgi:hypothetical protein
VAALRCKERNAMQKVTVGFSGKELWIPRRWTKFVFEGRIYERLDGVTFTFVGRMPIAS